MPSWNDLGTAFNTVRELDVSAISDESERPLTIACLGPRPLFNQIYGLLRAHAANRYGPTGRDPFTHQPIPADEPADDLRRADLLLILVDGRAPVTPELAAGLARLGRLSLPTVIAVCGVASPGELGQPRPEFAQASIVVLPDLSAPAAAAPLAEALHERLPEPLRLAAARAIPGLRAAYARELTSSVSFSNASYAFASAIPEQIPILAVPFAAADLLVLTKNQALMVYRLALAHGAPPDFQARIAELTPVIGGAFAWRQLARTLVGLIPVWGIVPKVAIAYAGTFATGVAASRWYGDSELLSAQRMRQITDEAMRVGRERARALVDAARAGQADVGARLGARLRRRRLGSGKAPDPKQQ